jgi:hypothetical protein
MSLALVAVFRGMTGEALSQLERGSTCDGATIFAAIVEANHKR